MHCRAHSQVRTDRSKGNRFKTLDVDYIRLKAGEQTDRKYLSKLRLVSGGEVKTQKYRFEKRSCNSYKYRE